jgi:hypothetical protein
VESDDSDREWDDYIRTEYGSIAAVRREPERDPDTVHVDLDDVLRQTFGMSDYIAADVAGREYEREEDGCHRPRSNSTSDDDDDKAMDEEDIPWDDADALERAVADEYDQLQEAAQSLLSEHPCMPQRVYSFPRTSQGPHDMPEMPIDADGKTRQQYGAPQSFVVLSTSALLEENVLKFTTSCCDDMACPI